MESLHRSEGMDQVAHSRLRRGPKPCKAEQVSSCAMLRAELRPALYAPHHRAAEHQGRHMTSGGAMGNLIISLAKYSRYSADGMSFPVAMALCLAAKTCAFVRALVCSIIGLGSPSASYACY
nr:hypothetical protein CFP56_11992 [Quercus suber]